MPTLATIMRHEAQLRQVSAEIRQASSIIDEARKGAEAAANDLAANWAGSARDAFVAEQAKTKTWWDAILDVISEIVDTIDKVNSAYTAVEETVTNLIKG